MKKLYTTMITLFFAINIMAQTATPPATGDGSSGNPYQIATLENLNWIASDESRWDKHYLQIADIDASPTINWNPSVSSGLYDPAVTYSFGVIVHNAEDDNFISIRNHNIGNSLGNPEYWCPINNMGWMPIGDYNTSFSGSYDGGGHAIDALYVNQPAMSDQGLFGITMNATITNLGVTNVNITAYYDVGGLAGLTYNSTVDNCYITGSITGTYNPSRSNAGGIVGDAKFGTLITNSYSSGNVSGTGYVGGLVGSNYSFEFEMVSIIENCYSSSTVSGAYYIGGLVGYNAWGSYVLNSHSTGNVSGYSDSWDVGGLVGINHTGSHIENSYSTGNVSGTNNVGGLSGSNDSYIKNSYATGTVNGENWIGGLVGENSGEITNSFAFGLVQGESNTGGLTGVVWEPSSITNSYWNTETSSQPASPGGEGRTTAEMTYPYAENTYVGWDFDDVWAADEDYSTNNGYPYLAWEAISFPTELYINNETFPLGFDDCIGAENLIEVSNTTVQSGANVVLIAGQYIKILSNTHIESGSEFLARIDTDGTFCDNYKSILAAGDEEPAKEQAYDTSPAFDNQHFIIYPNPTTASFTLELLDYEEPSIISIEIYNMLGSKILSTELPAQPQYNFSLAGQQQGIYLVRVMKGSEVGVVKVIKH